MFCAIAKRPSTPGSVSGGGDRARAPDGKLNSVYGSEVLLTGFSPSSGLGDPTQWILELAQGLERSEAVRFLIRSSFRMFCAVLAKEQAPTRQYYSRQISRALPRNKHAERSLGALDPCAVPHCLMSADQHVLAQARRSVATSRLVRSHSQLFSPRWTGQLGRFFLCLCSGMTSANGWLIFGWLSSRSSALFRTVRSMSAFKHS